MQIGKLVWSVVFWLVFSFGAAWFTFAVCMLAFGVMLFLGYPYDRHPADVHPIVYAAVGQVLPGIALMWRLITASEEQNQLQSERDRLLAERNQERMGAMQNHAGMVRHQLGIAADLLRSKGKPDDRKRVAVTRDDVVLNALHYMAERIGYDRQLDSEAWNSRVLYNALHSSLFSNGEFYVLINDVKNHRNAEFAKALNSLPSDVAQYLTNMVLIQPEEAKAQSAK